MGAFSGPETADDGIVLALDTANPRFSNYKGRSVAFAKSDYDGFTISNSTGWFDPNNTSQWTLEGWILDPGTTNSFQLYSGTWGSIGNFGFGISYGVSFQSGDGAWAWVTNTTLVADTGSPTGWNHFACTKNGSTFEVFLNGSRIYTGTPTFGTGGTGGSIHLQSYFSNTLYYADAAGLSNVRYVTGSVLYSGTSYTVPTEPLTAIPGTQLLIYQGNTFTDASPNNLILTVQNSPTISYNGPFSGSGWTDLTNRGNSGTLTNGPVFTQEPKLEPFGGAGAVQFDGSGDYLEIPYTQDFNFGTGDFTVECWANISYAQYSAIITSTPISINSSHWLLGYSNTTNQMAFGINSSGNAIIGADYSSYHNKWSHIAVSRSGTTLRMFFDGTQVASATNSTSFTGDSGNPIVLGRRYTNQSTWYLNGKISNVRLIKGTALYTSNFTPKRQPLLPESAPNTVLLTCQKGTIRDRSSSAHAITINGDAHSITGASYFEFDGTNDYVTIPDSDDFTFGSQNFTIDAWIYPTATGSFPSFISKYAGSSTNSTFFFSLGNSNQTLEFYLYNGVGGQQAVLQSGTVSLNAWNYVVAVRVGNRVATYLNGVEVASTTWTYSVYDANVNVTVGSGQYNGAFYFNGRISNTRILKGKGLTAAEVKQNYRNIKGRYGL